MRPADDETLRGVIRRYRLAAAAIMANAETRMVMPWQRDDFGMSNTAWIRWERQNRGKIPLGPGRHVSTEQWEQLSLFLVEEQLSLWSAEALRAAESAQYQTAVATQTFLTRYRATIAEEKLLPVAVPRHTVSTDALRGVPGATVWSRPTSTFRIALFEGRPVMEARHLAAQRARAILGTNVQLAHVRASVDYMRNRGDRENIVGYRRNPRGAKSCALCLLASTQRYHRGDLMPIHDHCHCVTVPIYGDHEPPQVIEPARLAGVHARIEAATGSSDLSGGHYRDAVIVHMHGELGPVLTYREHSFTGPEDLAS